MLLISPATDRFVPLAVQTARTSRAAARTPSRNASHESDARLLMNSSAARCLKSEDIAAGRGGQIPIKIAATHSPTSRGFLLQRLADAGPVSVAASVLTGVRNPCMFEGGPNQGWFGLILVGWPPHQDWVERDRRNPWCQSTLVKLGPPPLRASI